MTNEEALAAIKQYDRALVAWNSQTGEILAVTESGTQTDDFDRQVFALTASGVSVSSKGIRSEGATLATIEKLQLETRRFHERKQILGQWDSASVETMLSFLEEAVYDWPMKKDYDSRVIVDHLWHLHRDEWDPLSMLKLNALVGSEALGPDASFNLSCYLLAIERCEDELLSIWPALDKPGMTYSQRFTVMECLAHIRSTNRVFIQDMVRMVSMSGMLFGSRYEAMLALARIGHATWPDAAAVIRDKIYDSETWIIAFRDRALERIESEDDLWERCPECSYGRVHEETARGGRCGLCLGIGFVRRGESA